MKRIALAALAATIGVAGCTGPIIESHPFSGAALPKPDTLGMQHPAIFPTYGLPVAYYVVTVKRDEKCTLTVSLSTPIYYRDPGRLYNFAIRYDHDWYTDDTISIQTDANGLLTTVGTTSQNQAVAIATQALGLVAQLRPSITGESAPRALTATETPPPCKGQEIDVSHAINLNSRRQREDFAKMLPGLHLDVKALYPRSDDLPSPQWRTEPGESDNDGVYFRLNRPYRLIIEDTVNKRHADLIFAAPDSSATYRIRLDKRVFTKYDVKLAFEHGVLTKFESTDPSEALAALQAPANLIKAILGLSAL